MKIITMDLDSIILFLSDMDFSLEEDIEELENNFRNIFIRLRDLYDIDIQGYFRVDIYKDKYIGIIVDIKKEDMEFFDYLDGQIDMHISIHADEVILFEVDDLYLISNTLTNKIAYYIYHDKFYINVKEALTKFEKSYLLEFSNSILYGSMTKYILQKNNLL